MRILILLPLFVSAVASVNGQSAQSLQPSRLPEFWRSSGTRTPRDPWVSAEVTETVIGATQAEAKSLIAGSSIRDFIQPILDESRSRLIVGGIAAGPDGKGRAIISGVEVATGEKIPLPISAELARKIQGVARTYGLPVEIPPATESSSEREIILQVGPITMNGVALMLPGFTTSWMLEYRRSIEIPRPRVMPATK